MADENSKTEEPTPFKLQEARKKGQVNKSVEITSMLMMVAFLISIVIVGDGIYKYLIKTTTYLLKNSYAWNMSEDFMLNMFISLASDTGSMLSGLIVVLIVGAIAFNVVQTGFVASAHPIKPDFSRLNPVQGFKKIVSMKTVLDLVKSLLKVMFVFLFWWGSYDLWAGKIAFSYGMSIEVFLSYWFGCAVSLAISVFILLGPISIFDYYSSRRDFSKKMMMSMQDVKDEHKKNEGDPQIKQRQKQIQKELLEKSSSLKAVKDSDVVISNPTHISVALKYNSKKMIAPIIVSMGQNVTAMEIQKIARKNNIPIVRDKKLARKIYNDCYITGSISEDMYVGVAEIYRRILRA